MARAKTKIILELDCVTFGEPNSAKVVERLDRFFEEWFNTARGCHSNVGVKIFVPPDWEFVNAENSGT